MRNERPTMECPTVSDAELLAAAAADLWRRVAEYGCEPFEEYSQWTKPSCVVQGAVPQAEIFDDDTVKLEVR